MVEIGSDLDSAPPEKTARTVSPLTGKSPSNRFYQQATDVPLLGGLLDDKH